MEKGYLKVANRELKGWKVRSTEFRENEFSIRLSHAKGDQGVLVLKGIIAAKDSGAAGRPLREWRIEDHGSFKVFSLRKPNGGTVLRCEYMEGELR